MKVEERLKLFEEEINLIQNTDLKDKVKHFLGDVVPDYFFTVSASSTGKHHPSFSVGEGGLVRHTKMVVAVLKELLFMEHCEQNEMDCMIAACILHDTFKRGYTDCNITLITHPTIAADEWIKFIGEVESIITTYRLVYYCILHHMGQWGPESAKCIDAKDYKPYCSMVQLADYIASKKFFDMFKENPNDNK